ncbi:PulJ/GspJ family protein [Aurantimonas sp. NFXS3]|uniref:PulJ/GspJ family protein n=1 Tax=Aurantimonas sp. NFXS3 TaxID=2818434 RepID=UPI003B8CF320
MRRRSAHDRGFALIEAICVLLLSALVMATLSLATSVVVRHSEAAHTKTNQMEVLAASITAMKRDVSGIIAVRAGPAKDSPLLFSGSRTSINYAVAADGQVPETVVWIESHYESGVGALLRWETPLVPGKPTQARVHRSEPAVLMSGPWIFEFAYAQGGTDKALRWNNRWNGRSALPALLRLDVVDAETRGLVSSMIAPTHVDAIFDCITPEGVCRGEKNHPLDGAEDARR